MPVQLRGKKVTVQKLGKSGSGANSLLAMPEDTTHCGTIINLGPECRPDLKVGMKVYFADNRQQIRMEGKDLQLMDDDNIVGIAQD